MSVLTHSPAIYFNAYFLKRIQQFLRRLVILLRLDDKLTKSLNGKRRPVKLHKILQDNLQLLHK